MGSDARCRRPRSSLPPFHDPGAEDAADTDHYQPLRAAAPATRAVGARHARRLYPKSGVVDEPRARRATHACADGEAAWIRAHFD